MISSLAEAQRQGQPSGLALGLGMAGATRGAVLPAGAPATAVMQEEMQAMMARTLQSMQDLQRANGVEPNAQLLTTIQSLSQASLNAAMQAANLQAAEQLPKSLPVIPPRPAPPADASQAPQGPTSAGELVASAAARGAHLHRTDADPAAGQPRRGAAAATRAREERCRRRS